MYGSSPPGGATPPGAGAAEADRYLASPPTALARSEASILSPLRYPGSKRRLAGFIEQTIRQNGLHPALFVEPFAGGASVSLQLLNDGLVERIGLIDRDPLVAAFWQTVFTDTDWLIQQVETVPVTLEQWYQFKAAVPGTRRERALVCLFLNRTSFSGILAPGSGPLGGRKQTSANPLDCRFPRAKLVRRIQQAAALRERVAFVWNDSWKRGLSRLSEMQQREKLAGETFFYLDPPFFQKADRLYRFYFDDAGHARLRDFLLTLEAPWLLSYDCPTQVAELYGEVGAGAVHVELLYSTSSHLGRGAAKEVLLTNLPTLPTDTRLWRRTEEWNQNRVDAAPPAKSGGLPLLVPGTEFAANGLNGRVEPLSLAWNTLGTTPRREEAGCATP